MAKKKVAAARVTNLALGLAKKYISAKTGGVSDVFLGVTETQMAQAIQRLADNEFLPELTQNTNVADVIAAVRKAQKESGLTQDGDLGEVTFSWLMLLQRCFGKLGRSKRDLDGKGLSKVDEEADETRKPKEIRYFIDALPKDKVPNAEQLLQKAWESWMAVCGVIATQITDKANRSKANVIVGVRSIDGASNILADANIGPPRTRQLTLSFDSGEDWDEVMFEATACHEIGHLLGLRHTTTKGQLMFPRFVATVTSPGGVNAESDGGEDGKRARARWGPAPPEIPTVKRHSGSFLRLDLDDEDD